MAEPYVRYSNHGAIRNQKLSPRLLSALNSILPEMGLTLEVFSGGQPATGLARLGSHRHDNGNAADVNFYKDGRRLDWANKAHLPAYVDFVQRARAAGLTGFGAGPGYMGQGSMHIGYGPPAVWGAGGKGENAPEWLREAFNLKTAASPVQTAYAQPEPTNLAAIEVQPEAPSGALNMPQSTPLSIGPPTGRTFQMGYANAPPGTMTNADIARLQAKLIGREAHDYSGLKTPGDILSAIGHKIGTVRLRKKYENNFNRTRRYGDEAFSRLKDRI